MAQVKRIQFLLERLNKTGSLTKKQTKELGRIVNDALDQLGGENYRECSQDRILRIFGIDRRTLKTWISNGAPPSRTKHGRNYYDPGKLLKFRIAWQKRLDADNRHSEIEITRAKADLELANERIRKARVETDLKLKKLIPSADVWSVFRLIAQIIKTTTETEDDPIKGLEKAEAALRKQIPEPSKKGK